jgi:hypothetical protein
VANILNETTVSTESFLTDAVSFPSHFSASTLISQGEV